MAPAFAEFSDFVPQNPVMELMTAVNRAGEALDVREEGARREEGREAAPLAVHLILLTHSLPPDLFFSGLPPGL